MMVTGFLINSLIDTSNEASSFWYAFRQNDNTTIIPDFVTDQNMFSLACSDSGAYSGKSVQFTFLLSDSTDAFAGLGCRIAPDGKYVNLSGMTSVGFYIKGKGRIRVNFATQALMRYPEDQRWGTWGKIIDCPTQWEKIEIPASELVPQEFSLQESDSLTWKAVCDSVTNLHFTTSGLPGDTISMFLDEIYLKGVTLEDITY